MSQENEQPMPGPETGRSKRRLIGIVIALLVIAVITVLIVVVINEIEQTAGY
jgi:hypothetical protein